MKAGSFDAGAIALDLARVMARTSVADQATNGPTADQLTDARALLGPLTAEQLQMIALHLSRHLVWALESATGLEKARDTLDDLDIELRWQRGER